MIRKIGLPILIMAFILPGGCTLIPKYTRPEAPVPIAWPEGPAYRETGVLQAAPAAADLRWRDFFTDERIRTTVETALENNRDLRVAALNIEKARVLYRVQRGELFPTVDAGWTAFKQRVPSDFTTTGHSTTFDLYGAGAATAWEIDFFGRLRSLSEQALQQYFVTEQARDSAQILLVSETVSAYLTLIADRENLVLAQSTLETQQASYELIRYRYEVGLAAEQDLRQVQTRVDSTRVDVARFNQQVAQDENALNLLLGAPAPNGLVPERLSEIAPMPDVSPGISSEVLLHRPDILEAENMLKAANANIGAARAAFFPRISLATSVGTASSDLTGLFHPGSLAWNYAPQIVMPIFDPRLRPALEASKVDRRVAVAQYEKAIQAAFRDVADALAQRGTIGDQMTAQESLVEATRQTYSIATTRYEKGTDIYLNVLDAQRSFYSAQQGLISIRLARFTNQVRLYAVLGGGKE